MPPPIDATILAFIRDDRRLTSWLLLGACLRSLLAAFLPPRVAFLPATLLLGFRLGRTALMAGGLIHDSTQDRIARGRLTAQIPAGAVGYGANDAPVAGRDKEDFVVFIIGTRSNHPLGRLAPGFMQAGAFIQGTWKVIETERERWGYLGRTTDMLATDDEAGNVIVAVSYWRSMTHLEAFARSGHHLSGWQWYEEVTSSHPHLGLMHEVYSLPAGLCENVYRNMTPWGMGQTRYQLSSDKQQEGPDRALVEGLIPAVGRR